MHRIKHLLTIAILTPILITTSLLLAVQPARADGIIIPDPPPWPDPPPLRETWLTIRYHRVTVTIENQVAVTRVEQEFVNEHEWEAEGVYVFPLPEGAAISKFTMWVDGTPVEGKILAADEARAIYEEVVRNRRDPALLEYVGRDAVQARIFPIPPGGSRKIELTYSQVLPLDNGLVRYVYPLDTEKFSARPLEEVSVHVDVRSPDPMHALYSPTHQGRIYVERDGDYRARVGYEARDLLPEQDFELIYTVGQADDVADDVRVNLLTYRESADADGFFLLLAAPSVEVDEARVIPRDVILVLDTSGSMEGEKIKQAREALAYVLEHLNTEDRFNVIAFSTGLRQYGRGLRPVSEAREAIAWVARLEAIGGTDINRALLEALAQADAERPTLLIFLTDGLPTEGVTEIDQILDNVAGAAADNVRLFPFGVGDDVNTLLLDTLAERHRGSVSYVRPHERIDEEISAFYARIKTPVLSDVALDFDGVMVEETYPHPLPDLFAGAQLIVTGRYRDGGPARITLSGHVNGERQEFIHEGVFQTSGGDDFIPRLWATRKIGHLLTQIRLHGERQEWVDAIVDLSVRYGIITPYTSFLIEEDDILTARGREEAVERLMATPPPAAYGAPAAEAADDQSKMREAEAAAPLPTAGTANEGSAGAAPVRHVGHKTFKRQDGVWIDTAFDPSRMTTVKIEFGSANYFDWLALRPGWGAYFALGERVIFVAQDEAYEVVTGEVDPAPLPPADPTVAPEPTPGAGEETRVSEATPTGGGASPPAASGPCAGGMALVAALVAALWMRRRT
jgi:Ca-activated chloride channel homolog